MGRACGRPDCRCFAELNLAVKCWSACSCGSPFFPSGPSWPLKRKQTSAWTVSPKEDQPAGHSCACGLFLFDPCCLRYGRLHGRRISAFLSFGIHRCRHVIVGSRSNGAVGVGSTRVECGCEFRVGSVLRSSAIQVVTYDLGHAGTPGDGDVGFCHNANSA